MAVSPVPGCGVAAIARSGELIPSCLTEEQQEALLKQLDSPVLWIRIQALERLCYADNLTDSRIMDKAIEMFQKEKDPQIRSAIVKLLKKLDPSSIPDMYRRLGKSEPKPEPKPEPPKEKDPPALPALIEGLSDPDLWHSCVIALADLGDSSAIPALQSAFKRNPSKTIAVALLKLGDPVLYLERYARQDIEVFGDPDERLVYDVSLFELIFGSSYSLTLYGEVGGPAGAPAALPNFALPDSSLPDSPLSHAKPFDTRMVPTSASHYRPEAMKNIDRLLTLFDEAMSSRPGVREKAVRFLFSLLKTPKFLKYCKDSESPVSPQKIIALFEKHVGRRDFPVLLAELKEKHPATTPLVLGYLQRQLALYQLLSQPDFYDARLEKAANMSWNREVQSLIEETRGCRCRRFSDLSVEDKEKIVRLNGLLIEEINPNIPPFLRDRLLRQPGFYDLWLGKETNIKWSPQIQRLITDTSGYRCKPFSDLSGDEQKKILELNRLLMATASPQIPSLELNADLRKEALKILAEIGEVSEAGMAGPRSIEHLFKTLYDAAIRGDGSTVKTTFEVIAGVIQPADIKSRAAKFFGEPFHPALAMIGLELLKIERDGKTMGGPGHVPWVLSLLERAEPEIRFNALLTLAAIREPTDQRTLEVMKKEMEFWKSYLEGEEVGNALATRVLTEHSPLPLYFNITHAGAFPEGYSLAREVSARWSDLKKVIEPEPAATATANYPAIQLAARPDGKPEGKKDKEYEGPASPIMYPVKEPEPHKPERPFSWRDYYDPLGRYKPEPRKPEPRKGPPKVVYPAF